MPEPRTAYPGRAPSAAKEPTSAYPPDALRRLRERIEILPVLKAINYRLDTVQEAGDTVKCFCPIHSEAVFRTLAIDRRAHTYRCSYSLCPGSKGGDLIDLYAKALKIEYDEAVQRLIQHLKISIELPPSEDMLRKTLEVAENYLALNGYDDALAGFKKVLAVQSDNVRALEGMLKIHGARNEDGPRLEILDRLVTLTLSQGEFAKAAEHCQELLERRPNDTAVRLRYVECLVGQKEMHRALEEYMRLADYFETRQEFDRALEIYRKIEQLNLDIIDVYPHIIQLMVASDRTHDAVAESLRKAADHEHAGEYEQALNCYRAILEIDESRTDVRDTLVDAAIRAGLNEARIEECLALVEACSQEGSYMAAVQILEKLRQAEPKHVGISAKHSEILRRQGRNTAATETQLDMISVLIEQGRTEEAADFLRAVGPRGHLGVDSLKQLAAIQRQCGLSREAAETYTAVAEQLAEEKRWEEAADVCGRILEINPDDVSCRNRQIDLYLRAGRRDRAREQYLPLIESLIAQQQWDKAGEMVGRALEIAPDDLEILECQTRILAETGRIGEAQVRNLTLAQRAVASQQWGIAKRILQRLLAVEPDHVEAALLLADVGTALGEAQIGREPLQRIVPQILCQNDYARAQVVLNKLHEIAPDDVLTLVHLAAVYGNLGEGSQLLETLRKLVIAYIANGAYAKAAEYCMSILDRDPENIWALEQMILLNEKTDKEHLNAPLCVRLAQIHEKLGEADRVQEYYERALDIEPANSQARMDYIHFLLGVKQYEVAAKHARQAIGHLSEQQRYPEAIQMAESLLEHVPDDIALRRSLIALCQKGGQQHEFITQCTQLINLHYQRNELAEVADLYEELLSYEPGNVTFRTRLIEALMRLKRHDEAREQYLNLARFYLGNNNYEDAENTVRELLNQFPANPQALDILVEVLLKAGRLEEAAPRARELSEIYVGTGNSDKAIEVLRRVLALDPNNREIAQWLEEVIRADQALQGAKVGRGARSPAPGAAGVGELQVVSDFTFDTFVIGDRNRFAHATALAVAKAPAMHYNPLFLYGDVGLGKTHLLSAIANYILEHQPELRILYTSAEEFTSQLVDAIQDNTANALRSRYKAADVLLMDDIQFLAGKERAQEEFFHIFNTLFQSKRQIVVTSDRPPKEIERLEKRLKSRFGSGIIVDIQTPDFETRAAILKREIKLHGDVQMDNRLIGLIAERIQTNVRELKGALKQILVKAEITHVEINEALVRQVLERYVTQI